MASEYVGVIIEAAGKLDWELCEERANVDRLRTELTQINHRLAAAESQRDAAVRDCSSGQVAAWKSRFEQSERLLKVAQRDHQSVSEELFNLHTKLTSTEESLRSAQKNNVASVESYERMVNRRDELARKLAATEESLRNTQKNCAASVEAYERLVNVRDRYKSALEKIAACTDGGAAFTGNVAGIQRIARSALSPDSTPERFGAEICEHEHGRFYARVLVRGGYKFVNINGEWDDALQTNAPSRHMWVSESGLRAALATASDPFAHEKCGCGCKHCPSKAARVGGGT